MFERSRSRLRKRSTETASWKRGLFGVVSLFLVVGMSVLVGYVTRLPALTVDTITVTGGETLTHGEVEAVVSEALSGDYLGIVPFRFTLLFPRDHIAAALHALPRLRDADIERTARTLTVTFTEYTPFALWCADDETGRCYFLDAEGYAFSEAPTLSGGALVRFVEAGRTELSEIQAFTPDEFAHWNKLIDAVHEELSLRVVAVRCTEGDDLTLTLGGGGALLVRRDAAVQDLIDRAQTVLSSRSFSHLEPGNFQYIDLRFGNKVFVNETDPTATTTPTTTPLVPTPSVSSTIAM